MPWRDLLGPAIELAGEGLLVDWWTTLMIASSAADLRRYGASAAAYLQDGLPPYPQWSIRAKAYLPQDRLKATIEQLAAKGARDFYEGDLAKSIAADVQAAGGALSASDLAAFRAHAREPLHIPYRGGTVVATPELTAGPTLAHALRLLQKSLRPGHGKPDASAYARPCNRPIASGSRAWAMPTEGVRSAPRNSRPPAPRTIRWSTVTATWRR
jgi:gamma-glutamyltranspeptidase/glutathione hydrolase